MANKDLIESQTGVRRSVDRYGRSWDLPASGLCPECGQPDNCGDCDHYKLAPAEVKELGGFLGIPTAPQSYRILANRVSVILTVDNHTNFTVDNKVIHLSIDRYEMVELDTGPTLWKEPAAIERQELIDFLIEIDLVEWRAIGPEDSEIFLTEKGRTMFAAQLESLWADWREWKP